MAVKIALNVLETCAKITVNFLFIVWNVAKTVEEDIDNKLF